MKSRSKIPINVKKTAEGKLAQSPKTFDPPRKFSMDPERYSITRKFRIYAKGSESEDVEAFEQGKLVEGYFTIGYYDDGYPGEVFIYAGKQGEETHGWVHSLAKSVSLMLQYGIRPDEIYDKLLIDEYEPKGITNVPEAPICKSIIDLVLRYMKANFPVGEDSNSEETDGYGGLISLVAEAK